MDALEATTTTHPHPLQVLQEIIKELEAFLHISKTLLSSQALSPMSHLQLLIQLFFQLLIQLSIQLPNQFLELIQLSRIIFLSMNFQLEIEFFTFDDLNISILSEK